MNKRNSVKICLAASRGLAFSSGSAADPIHTGAVLLVSSPVAYLGDPALDCF